MGRLAKTDLVLVNRSANSYKIRAEYLQDSINPPSLESPQIISPQDGAGLGDGTSSYALTSEIIQVDEVPGDNGEVLQSNTEGF